MSLTVGDTLGPFEVQGTIGAGGMGEVYQARDTKLNRSVALKILPAAFAGAPDRLARFRREAQVLAALNHPNIAAIYGIEDSGATHALVMELVPGQTLADLMKAPLPLSEALPIVRQIAAALEAAHEQGIVHRDLKPANIKITEQGTAKVLDFGLAKAFAGAGQAPGDGLSANESTRSALTMTSPAMTGIGVILGTAGYMAPEQAKGKSVDHRADLWAVGVVLFEMLTGRRLFDGDTVTETIANVITQHPAWEALPAGTPPPIRRLLRRCLEKDPRNRLQSAGDLRIEIDEYLAAPEVGSDVASTPAAGRRYMQWLPWGMVAGLAAALAFVGLRTPTVTPHSARLDVRLGSGEVLHVDDNLDGTIAVLSPDGQTLAYLAAEGNTRRIFVRPLDRLESSALPGTDGATQQFFSPDGREIAFFADGQLKRAPLTGGAPATITRVVDLRGGTWGPDGTIVYAPATTSGLSRVPATGGTPVELTKLSPEERTHRWPSFLPNGKAVLFMSQPTQAAYDDGTIEVVRLDTGERKVVVRGGTAPQYAAGHVLYARRNTLYAVPFDEDRLEIKGEPKVVATGIMSSGGGVGAGSGDGSAQFTIASNGTAAYISGTVRAAAQTRLLIVDRTGKTLYELPEKRVFADPKFSPDGRTIAVRMLDGTTEHLYAIEPARDAMTPLTFEGPIDGMPVWSADGKSLAYYSGRGGRGLDLYVGRSDGTGTPHALTSDGGTRVPGSFSPDGRLLAASVLNPATNMDIVMVSTVDGSITPFIASAGIEMLPAFSPDGRWLAYQSAGANVVSEVFVRSYPDGAGFRQVSSGGGVSPVWTKDGRELIYSSESPAGAHVISVAVTPSANGGLTFGRSQVLFELPFAKAPLARWFDASRDGSRFAVVLTDGGAAAETARRHLTLVFNFFDDIRRASAVQAP